MSGVERRPALRLELSPSKALTAILVAVHGAAAVSAVLAFPGAPGAALGAALLALGAASAWQRALLKGARSPAAIEIPAAGDACIVLRNREMVPARAEGGLGAGRYWVSLRIGAPGRSFLVTGDMVEAGQFRLLRLWARWGRVPGVAPRQLPA